MKRTDQVFCSPTCAWRSWSARHPRLKPAQQERIAALARQTGRTHMGEVIDLALGALESALNAAPPRQ
jgi:hypothetical protein